MKVWAISTPASSLESFCLHDILRTSKTLIVNKKALSTYIKPWILSYNTSVLFSFCPRNSLWTSIRYDSSAEKVKHGKMYQNQFFWEYISMTVCHTLISVGQCQHSAHVLLSFNQCCETPASAWLDVLLNEKFDLSKWDIFWPTHHGLIGWDQPKWKKKTLMAIKLHNKKLTTAVIWPHCGNVTFTPRFHDSKQLLQVERWTKKSKKECACRCIDALWGTF